MFLINRAFYLYLIFCLNLILFIDINGGVVILHKVERFCFSLINIMYTYLNTFKGEMNVNL